MPIETFAWPTQHGDAPEITYRVRSSQFGDGYKQIAADGPNNKEASYPITFTGSRTHTKALLGFLDRHAGARAFLWTTPLGELGLFTCENPVPTPLGGGLFKVTATFVQAFHP